jgi:signal transduction histidine kinase
VLLIADKNMLITILNNLIMNSIKFTPLGGKITISASKNIFIQGSEKEFVKISVADTGIGMEASDCDKLFKSAKPESRPGTAKEEGTGLGLLLAREMVERHGGIINVESAPGVGSVFSFTIPAYQKD